MEKEGLERRIFGLLPSGEKVEVWTLSVPRLRARVMAYGAALVSLETPDRSGRLDDIVLGFDSLEGYLGPSNPYFGATVGRCANRISCGAFSLDGKRYHLARNDGPNHLHGGLRGFDKALWKARASGSPGAPAVEFSYLSPDGEEGYPGNLSVTVTYTLSADELRIDYLAQTDAPTPCNLSNHAYFNLEGEGKGDVLDHLLKLDASRITEAGPGLIPTGALKDVAGGPFDFRSPARIGDGIDAVDPQLALAGGYDHNWVLDRVLYSPRPAARVEAPLSGRVMEVLTSEPALQFYAGNFLPREGTPGKGGKPYPRRGGLCLETQHYPDSPNRPEFPSVILRPGLQYASTTMYRFPAS